MLNVALAGMIRSPELSKTISLYLQDMVAKSSPM